jgi:dihydroorotate dehydrogenase
MLIMHCVALYGRSNDGDLLYDITKSFEYHVEHGLPLRRPDVRVQPPAHHATTIFGHPVASALGVAACPLTTAQGIAALAYLGYSIFTYKTVRNRAFPAHPLPNIAYVHDLHDAANDHAYPTCNARSHKPTSGPIGLVNSFGNACLEPAHMLADIRCAKDALTEQQFLMVSIYGTGDDITACADDFAALAQRVVQAGADAVECNLSCPNIPGKPPLYLEPDLAYCIMERVVQAVNVPVLIKIGYCTESTLRELLLAAVRAGVQGVCAINSLAVQAHNEDNEPYFGPARRVCGMSGDPIRAYALDMIKQARAIITHEQLPLTLFATGGVISLEHIDLFFAAGADVVMSASGVMLDPYLAMNYYTSQQSKE